MKYFYPKQTQREISCSSTSLHQDLASIISSRFLGTGIDRPTRGPKSWGPTTSLIFSVNGKYFPTDVFALFLMFLGKFFILIVFFYSWGTEKTVGCFCSNFITFNLNFMKILDQSVPSLPSSNVPELRMPSPYTTSLQSAACRELRIII